MTTRRTTCTGFLVAVIVVSAVIGACSEAPNPETPSSSTTTTLSTTTSVVTEDLTVIVGVRVFDGRKVIPEKTVVFSHDEIVSVGEGGPPEGATVVDGTGKTLLPGLIDAHQHVWSRLDLQRNTTFGVTTALDMFTFPDFAAAMRAEQNGGGALDLLVETGMTPTEALAAATSVPAVAFRLDDRGIIEPGRKADLLLVEGDPTTDITATRRIDTIWKDGVPVEREQPRDPFDPAGSE